jgi:lantibiotic leader peptide-processing serine protease
MNKLPDSVWLMVAWLTACISLLMSAPASAGQDRFIVLYKGNSVPESAARDLSTAGGTLIWRYSQIGVAIAQSGDPNFATKARAIAGVQGAASTSAVGMQVNGGGLTAADALVAPAAVPTPATPAAGDDNLSGLQWDMIQISTPQAHAINAGSRSVLVGDIDTGLDYTHPDLAPNVDFSNSVSCLGGVPNQDPAAWNDDNGHGTHTAGTIAAARNGIGIVGVAPNVRIAAIKAGDSAGFFFPEAVICAFVWAGSHHIQVTNNSYFADPWLFNCRNDAGQRAIWEAERRAIRYAMQNGTVVVTAEGNNADDLAHPTTDVTSPDNTTPVSRDITNACAVVPVEVSGVIGVSANGNLLLKSFYSSYGVGSVQVIAPGGDSILQKTAGSPNGRVLSTWPASLISTCPRKVFDGAATYCYQQGTSMASPHVAGIAALIASTGVASPGAIAAKVVNTADSQACPEDLSIYAFFPSVSNGALQACQGGAGYNSFNGHGQVNALTAVSK